MTISGSKSVKKGQKVLEKATNLVFNKFSFVLANLKYINGYNMMKKKSPTWRSNTSFLNLLTRANNYRKFVCDFLAKK